MNVEEKVFNVMHNSIYLYTWLFCIHDAISVTWHAVEWNLWIIAIVKRMRCVRYGKMPYIIKHAECISSLSSLLFSVVILIFFWRQHVCFFLFNFIRRPTNTSSEMAFKRNEKNKEMTKRRMIKRDRAIKRLLVL